mgnify:CR=1 FL=1
MARKFVSVNVAGVLSSLNAIENEASGATQDLQMELARAGAEKMKELIETRGTGRMWGRTNRMGDFTPTPLPAKVIPYSGKLKSGGGESRVNTGRMRDSIRVKFQRGEQKTLSSFGWIGANGEDEKYFMAQEYGFEAGGFRPDKKVDGMFALRDARLYVSRDLLPRLIRKYQNRIAKGKY